MKLYDVKADFLDAHVAKLAYEEATAILMPLPKLNGNQIDLGRMHFLTVGAVFIRLQAFGSMQFTAVEVEGAPAQGD